MEFAGNCYDLYQPEVGDAKPDSDSEIVTIPCPACSFKNNFLGKLDPAGFVIEHYGRQCQGYSENESGNVISVVTAFGQNFVICAALTTILPRGAAATVTMCWWNRTKNCVKR